MVLILMENCLFLVRNSYLLSKSISSEISSPWIFSWIVSGLVCELYCREGLEMCPAFRCLSPWGWFAAPSVFRRRFILGTATGTVIALGADFLGSTSAILSLNPEFFRGIRADVLYPIRGYKRCYETSRGFGAPQFLLPCLAFYTSRLIGYVSLCFQLASRFSSLWLLWGIFSLVHCKEVENSRRLTTTPLAHGESRTFWLGATFCAL